MEIPPNGEIIYQNLAKSFPLAVYDGPTEARVLRDGLSDRETSDV